MRVWKVSYVTGKEWQVFSGTRTESLRKTYKMIGESSLFAEEWFDKTKQIFDLEGKHVLLQFSSFDDSHEKSTHVGEKKKETLNNRIQFTWTSFCFSCCFHSDVSIELYVCLGLV